MYKFNRIPRLILACVLTLGLVFSSAPLWAEAADEVNAEVASVRGTVTVKRAASEKSFAAFTGLKLKQGDVVTVAAGGEVAINIGEDKTVKGLSDSSFKISNLTGTDSDSQVGFTLIKGTVFNEVRAAQSSTEGLTVRTGNTVAGVRGTTYTVCLRAVDGVTVRTLEGSVFLDMVLARLEQDANASLVGEQKTVGAGEGANSNRTGVYNLSMADFTKAELEYIKDHPNDFPPDMVSEAQKLLDNWVEPTKSEEGNNQIVYDTATPPSGGGGGGGGNPPVVTNPPASTDYDATSVFNHLSGSTPITLTATDFGGNTAIQIPAGSIATISNNAYDVTLSGVTLTVNGRFNNNTALTLAGGATINNVSPTSFYNYGTLFLGNSILGSGSFNNSGSGKLVNEGTIEIISGVFNMSGGTITNTAYGAEINNYATFNMTGGTIDSGEPTSASTTIYNYDSGDFNMSNGAICVYATDGGGFYNSGIIDMSGGTLTLAVVDTDRATLENTSTGSISLSGGTLYNYGVISNDMPFTISGSGMLYNAYESSISNNGTLAVNGGTLNNCGGLYLLNGSNFGVTGGTLSGSVGGYINVGGGAAVGGVTFYEVNSINGALDPVTAPSTSGTYTYYKASDYFLGGTEDGWSNAVALSYDGTATYYAEADFGSAAPPGSGKMVILQNGSFGLTLTSSWTFSGVDLFIDKGAMLTIDNSSGDITINTGSTINIDGRLEVNGNLTVNGTLSGSNGATLYLGWGCSLSWIAPALNNFYMGDSVTLFYFNMSPYTGLGEEFVYNNGKWVLQ